MRKRTEILKDLVLLQGDVQMLEKELSRYSWDIEKPLFKMGTIDLTNVLKKSVDDKIDFQTITNWANAIECREDLEFEREEIQEIIFELANPEMNGEITKGRLGEIIAFLEK